MRIDVPVGSIDTVEYAVCSEELSGSLGEGRTSEGGCWTLELADALNGARERRYAFYVVVGGRRVDLVLDARAGAGDELSLRPADGPRAYARPVSSR